MTTLSTGTVDDIKCPPRGGGDSDGGTGAIRQGVLRNSI